MRILNGRAWTMLYNNVQAVAIIFLVYNMILLTGKKHLICGKAVW